MHGAVFLFIEPAHHMRNKMRLPPTDGSRHRLGRGDHSMQHAVNARDSTRFIWFSQRASSATSTWPHEPARWRYQFMQTCIYLNLNRSTPNQIHPDRITTQRPFNPTQPRHELDASTPQRTYTAGRNAFLVIIRAHIWHRSQIHCTQRRICTRRYHLHVSSHPELDAT